MATIVIDPGHGGTIDAMGSTARGAVGSAGTVEKQLTLAVAQAMQQILTPDHSVLLTRNQDINMSAAQRAAVARDNHAEVFISIHFNSHTNPDKQGTEIMVRPVNGQLENHSQALAHALKSALVTTLGHPDLGLRTGPWAVLNERLHDPRTARCLAEISFLTDPAEEQRVLQPDYISRIATALAQGVHAYLQQTVIAQGQTYAAAGGRVANIAYDPDAYSTKTRPRPAYGQPIELRASDDDFRERALELIRQHQPFTIIVSGPNASEIYDQIIDRARRIGDSVADLTDDVREFIGLNYTETLGGPILVPVVAIIAIVVIVGLTVIAVVCRDAIRAGCSPTASLGQGGFNENGVFQFGITVNCEESH